MATIKSIEEKAKAYDEAVINGSRLWECGEITRENYEYIFPELKESEDERMVKFIKKQLFNIKKTITENYELDAKLTNAIDWLEKQGEHTNFRNKIQIGDEVTRNEDGVLVNLSQLKRVVKKDEKQGEQKPTLPKWRYKNDNLPLLRDSIILNKYGCVAKSPSGAIVCDVWVIDYDELAKLPKEEFEKQGEQKPADNEMIEILRTEYEKGRADAIEEMQNPAWSEEDEARFESCIKVLQTSDEYDTINVKWLKSLKDRYAWKPSDEQISIIEFVMEDIEKDSIRYAVLNSILEQLKKLKS